MNEPFSIVPPPELVEQWRTQPEFAEPGLTSVVSMTQSRLRDIATQAAQWGADQELDACITWLVRNDNYPLASNPLRTARRPKPPSLKEQALLQLDTLNADLAMHGRGCDLSQIRRALEARPEPVAVNDALIKAECALSDVAEGEPECDDGDPAQWAEQRCAETLAIIRPVMKLHKIRTSEWPPQPMTTPANNTRQED
jgi:hypothetical protein